MDARLAAEKAVQLNRRNYLAQCMIVFSHVIFFDIDGSPDLYKKTIEEFPDEKLEYFQKCYESLRLLEKPDVPR